jgi:predicted transcriptional regulator
MIRNAILLSIHPRHAGNIFGGTKTMELRRTCPKLNAGDLVLVYVSAPIKALMGAFTVGRVLVKTPEELWFDARGTAAVTKEEFDAYFSGAALGYGICISDSWTLAQPVHLERLRELAPGFHPPQSFIYAPSGIASAFVTGMSS